MSKRNRYSKALKHLKSTRIEEKIQCLDEALPTNHTKGLYSLNPPGFRVGIPDPRKTFYPDVDGNWPSGIPGTPGDLTYERPAGYWSGERDWDTLVISDFSQDYLQSDPTGKSTAGLIADDGTVLAGLPPGGESFILGPLTDGWVLNHTTDAYTNIGYLQKDTRQFVLLGRITGQWKADLNSDNPSVPIWDGTSTGFTSYNENFTLAMAQWVRQKILDGKYTPDVPYFYSGGVPQEPQDEADCPLCPPGMYGGHGIDPSNFGKGGDPDIGTQQGPPASGDATDDGYPSWGPMGDKKDGIDDLVDGLTDSDDSIDDFIDGIIDAFGDGIVKPLGDSLDTEIADVLGPNTPLPAPGWTPKPGSDFRPKPLWNKPKPAGGFGKWGTNIKLASYEPKGNPLIENASAAPTSTTATDTSTSTGTSSSDLKPIADTIAKEVVDKKGVDVAKKMSDGLKDYAKENDIPLDQEYQTPEQRKIETDKLYPNVAKIGNQTHFDNPEYVKAMVEYEKWHNPKIRAEYERKMDWLRTNFTLGPGNSGYDSTNKWVRNYHDNIVSSKKELESQYKNATYGASKPEETKPEETKPWWDRDDDGEGKLSDTDYASAAAATAERKKKKDFEARMAALDAEIAGYDAAVKAAHAEMRNIVIQFGIDAALTIFGGALLKGGASAIKALRGYSALSKAQKAAKTQKAWNALAKPQPKPWTSSSYNPKKPLGGPARKRFPVGDSYEPKGRVITESSFTPRQRKILREIKNPIVIKEAPKKYKMNFAGKYSSQNTPDKTASAVSDGLVASGNARGQRWRLEDKYWQGYETTERMNIIYDRVGHGSQAWERTIEEARRKNGWRNREIQEQLNIHAHEKAMRNIDPDYQSPWSIEIVETTAENEKRFDRVNKIKQVVSQGTNKKIAGGKRGVAPEYPDEAPPEMINGYHPKLVDGKDISNRFNKLDPQSAEAMPKTGNPHIDAKVEKAKKNPDKDGPAHRQSVFAKIKKARG